MSVKYKDQTIAGRTIAMLPDADVYSTDETVVGTWIDGKPVYRKVFKTTTPAAINTPSNIINIAELQTDTIISVGGNVRATIEGGYYVFPVNIMQPTGSLALKFSITCWIRQSENVVAMNVIRESETNAPCVIVIEYTKTTDTATINIPDTAAMNTAYDEGVQSV